MNESFEIDMFAVLFSEENRKSDSTVKCNRMRKKSNIQ